MFIKDIHNLNPIFKLSYEQAKALLDNGKQVDIEVKEHINKRSSEQNAYYWIVNGLVADCLNDAGMTYGEFKLPYNKDLIHDIHKHIFGVRTTTKLKVGEFCDYMTKIFSFWIEKTRGAFEVPELPQSYLERKGYTEMMK